MLAANMADDMLEKALIMRPLNALVAQLDRVLGYDAGPFFISVSLSSARYAAVLVEADCAQLAAAVAEAQACLAVVAGDAFRTA